MTILIDVLGIQDSGGITVLDKLITELIKTKYTFFLVCNKNENILALIEKYSQCNNLEFELILSKGFIHRLYYENIIFRKIIKQKNIHLIYNFSGTAQFLLPIPQITKVHNLLFYSKKLDKFYFENKQYIRWFRQVFAKRLVFHNMIKQTKYIEVQSNHVKEYMSDFINISNKKFFIKSDIDVSEHLFNIPKKYDFSKRIRFLYIVGPHFEYLHKNFEDFVKALLVLKKENFNFEIIVTLTKEQLINSNLWDKSLDDSTTFIGYVSKDELKNQFQNNTIVISTSVIETLGLHVIEAVQNGILTIVPNEQYSLDVYGSNILTYELFDINTLVSTIKNISLLDDNEIKDIIFKNQNYLMDNEKMKYNNVVEIFDLIFSKESAIIRKDKNV